MREDIKNLARVSYLKSYKGNFIGMELIRKTQGSNEVLN